MDLIQKDRSSEHGGRLLRQPATGKNPAIFMCKCCNLFSPSQSELLSHVSEKHTEEGVNVDEIIIPLRPLSTPEPAHPSKAGDELSVTKRKRGRPKGSTKKPSAEEELVGRRLGASEAPPRAPEEGGSLAPRCLECPKCSRKFSNLRQLRKHICIIVLSLGEAEGDAGNESDLELKRSLRKKIEKRPEATADARRESRAFGRASREELSRCPHEAIQVTSSDRPGSAPARGRGGATRGTSLTRGALCLHLRCHQDYPSGGGAPRNRSHEPEATPADLAPRRGYQEYAIQQTPYEQPMKSSRLGPTQLKIFTCEYCNKVFKFKHSLQAHLRIHTNEKPYTCAHCSYASAIKANLNVHLRKHTGEKFSCDCCAFTCLSKGHLKVHVERVHKKVKQHCRFCKKKYSDVKNLIKHVRDAHDPQDPQVREALDGLRLLTREGKRQLLYDCHVCERKFKNELDRDRHMLVHGDQWPFACELCGHGATKYQALELHVRKHPFVYVSSAPSACAPTSGRRTAPRPRPPSSPAPSTRASACWSPAGTSSPRRWAAACRSPRRALPPRRMRSPSRAEGAGGPAAVPTPRPEALPRPPGSWEPLGSPRASPPRGLVEKRYLLCRGSPRSGKDPAPPARRLRPVSGAEVTPLLPTAGSPAANQDTQGAESPGPHGPDPAEAADRPVVPGEEAEALRPPDLCGPGPERRANMNAFLRILDGLAKRRMDPGLCERIRKVYGDLECEYCGKLFWYQVHFDMHVRTHTREHLYYCSQCHYSSITKNCLKRHVIQKHSNILLKCPTDGCDYSTPDKYKLQAHLKVHTELDKRSYSCPVCEKSFSEDRLIKSHIKTNHPEVSMSTISEVLGRRVQLKGLIGKRAMKCPYCDFYFMKNGSDLQRHIWAHEGVKPFKCSLCEYATRSKSNLKAHMNRHSTEKTHLCDMCGKKFKSKGTLKSHKLLHTADGKQFKCTVCDYTAAQKPQLLRHMEQHASFKPFRCAHCHYSCNMSGSLKRHYNRKHPNEEYANVGAGELAADALVRQGGLQCPVCSFVYGTRWELSRHLKNKHGLKLVETEGEPKWEPATEPPEEPAAQYLHITEAEEDVQGTQAAVAALQDLRYTSESGDRLDPTAVNILQQIIELGSEAHDATAVASVVAMAPGTVTVVKQVTDEEPSSNHTVMIQETLQQASVELAEQHHLVVSSDDVEGIETVTVYTQGGEPSEFIVYVQEAMQPAEEPPGGQPAPEL
ncbi:hypothetical protein QTO34_007548 [Cnephaeus nilssonii]|uniref:Zinc finger protein ZFAT n=1 Tax=Cnephaeus nilssonii TaxID=3371016 RepID=A0AA40HJ92_CNENI|nr:hypothetical protein QTO34_007548 [Eptesicus nilssonii]